MKSKYEYRDSPDFTGLFFCLRYDIIDKNNFLQKRKILPIGSVSIGERRETRRMIVVKRADNIESPDALIARLVQEYQVPLRRMCCIWLKDAALAEDAVQETFVKAWRAALSFRGECSEKTWLMRIAVHVCWDMRRSWWFRHVDRSVRLEHLPEPAVPFEERDDTLVRAVCALPAHQREAVLLYYYQDMTLTEIAQVLEVAPSTVKRRLDSAHKALQRKLEGG